jgi:hypothetical protein
MNGLRLRAGQISGDGPRKRAVRNGPFFKRMRSIFMRTEVVYWDNEPEIRPGIGLCFYVGLLDTKAGNEASQRAKDLGLPLAIEGIPVIYQWTERSDLAAWVRQNYFWIRPEENTVPINEPYTTDADLLSQRIYQNPMRGGIEVFAESQHRNKLRGASLSGIVYDAMTGTKLLLSCAHVFAMGAFSNGGTLPIETVGHNIYQPRYPDLAGQLLRWGTNNDPSNINIDAAVATIAGGRTISETSYGPYGTIAKAPALVPNNGNSVFKIGRSTGKTIGSVASTSASVTIAIEGTLMTFADVIRVTYMTMTTGDSGSMVFLNSGSNNPIGVLFAGDSLNAYIIKATLIEEDLGISFMPVEVPATAARSFAVVIG